jgi:hypothetical protein
MLLAFVQKDRILPIKGPLPVSNLKITEKAGFTGT